MAAVAGDSSYRGMAGRQILLADFKRYELFRLPWTLAGLRMAYTSAPIWTPAGRYYRQSVQSNGPYAVVIIVFIAVSNCIAWIYDLPMSIGLYGRFAIITALLAFFVLCGASAWTLVADRPEKPFRHIASKLVNDWGAAERLCLGVPVLFLTPLFASTNTSIKSSIGVIVPYYADPYLADIDRIIHGGDAWQLLHPVLGYPIASYWIGAIYFLWIPVTSSVLAYVAFMRGRNALRAQYLLASVLTWILLGLVLAMAFASVGPCYYAEFYPDAPFADLSSYFTEAGKSYEMSSVAIQNMLLESRSASAIGFGEGISAFPSLHVAMATLMTIFAWHFGKVWRWLSVAFLVAIMLGSVHLGWHYAIDGEVSMVLVPFIWWFSGWVVRSTA